MSKVIIGIDVSKRDLSVALQGKAYYKKCKISNDLKGFEIQSDWLKDQVITKV